MADYAENDAFVRDLKNAARHDTLRLEDDEDAFRITTDTALIGSRAAMLSLIDLLARKSLPALSITGIAISVIAAVFTLSF